MSKFKRLSTVIVFIILLVQTCVFFGLTGYNYWNEKNRLYEELEQNINQTRERLSNSLPVLLWNFNEEAIKRSIEAEINNIYIESIIIKFYEKIEYQFSKSEKTIIENKSLGIVLNYRGDDGSGYVGDLFITPNENIIEEKLQQKTKIIIIQSIILNSSLAILILLILYKLVIQPINKTNKNLKDITREGADLSKRLNETYIGEIGELAQNYNKVAQYVFDTIKEKEQAFEQATENAKIKSEFLASMSHEIRTPMNGVLGMLDLVLNGELDEQQKHYITLAHKSAHSLLTIINDILDFSKIEAGKLELDLHDFNLCEMIGDIAEANAVKAQEKGLEVILNTKNIRVSKVKSDNNRIRQILNNIIGNAVKFTQHGEIIIRAGIEEHHQKMIFNCNVIDTGIGIPEDKQHLLFDSFSQVDASTTRKYGGTGLGLAIVKQLCRLFNGTISVNSKLNEGSRFDITLELEKATYAEIIMLPEFIKKTILVVDKNHNSLSTIKEQLLLWQAHVLTVDNSTEALEVIKHQKVDLILITMEMPNISGLELGEILQQQNPNLPKVMLTTMCNKGDLKKFSELNFLGQVSKPITLNDWYFIARLCRPHLELNQSIKFEPAINNEENFNILLVEDNLINQKIASVNIEKIGFSVHIANNGLEAIRILNDTNQPKFQLIIMDCQMPEMDGYEATQCIRRGDANKAVNYSNIPIIAMTANAMEGDREKCLAAGMDDYMSKPIQSEQLTTMLQKWLN